MRSISVLTCLLLLAATAFAYPGGAPNGYAGNPPSNNNCVNCHSSYPLNSGNGSLVISGLPAGGYQSNTTYHLTATLADPGQQRWGFELTPIYQSGGSYLQAGTMTVTDPSHTSLSNGSGTSPDYLKQNSSGTYNGTPGPTSWNFDWMAPDVSTGALAFYIAGAACNGTGGTSSDYCYTASFLVNPAGGAPNFNVTLTYVSGSPVPASGGNITFDIYILNASGAVQNYDAWLATEYQGGVPTTLVLRSFTNFQPGWAINRPGMFFPVPSGWAGGSYNFFARVGNEPLTVWVEDSFPFTKSGADIVEGFVPWAVDNAPNPFDEILTDNSISATDFELLNSYPNPFNPTTTISYQLSAFSQINLSVYNIAGREVMTLVDGWMDQGAHEAVFDAAALPSGIYLAKLTTSNQVTVTKLVLMK